MFVMDVPPDVPAIYAPVVIAQAAQPQTQTPQLIPVGCTKIDRTIGICQLINNPPNPPLSAVNATSPRTAVWGYLQMIEKLTPAQLPDEMFSTAKTTLLQGAAHGTVVDEGGGYYRYDPTPGYFGTDRATTLVEMGGRKFKVVYHFKVMDGGAGGGTDGYDPYMQKKNCPKGIHWKISLNPDDPNSKSMAKSKNQWGQTRLIL